MTRTPSQIGRGSRNKGAANERKLAQLFASMGFAAHRAVQWKGSQRGDVVLDDWPEIYVECKAVRDVMPWQQRPSAWLVRACEDAMNIREPKVQQVVVLCKIHRGPWALVEPFNGWARTGCEHPQWVFGTPAITRRMREIVSAVTRSREGGAAYARARKMEIMP